MYIVCPCKEQMIDGKSTVIKEKGCPLHDPTPSTVTTTVVDGIYWKECRKIGELDYVAGIDPYRSDSIKAVVSNWRRVSPEEYTNNKLVAEYKGRPSRDLSIPFVLSYRDGEDIVVESNLPNDTIGDQAFEWDIDGSQRFKWEKYLQKLEEDGVRGNLHYQKSIFQYNPALDNPITGNKQYPLTSYSMMIVDFSEGKTEYDYQKVEPNELDIQRLSPISHKQEQILYNICMSKVEEEYKKNLDIIHERHNENWGLAIKESMANRKPIFPPFLEMKEFDNTRKRYIKDFNLDLLITELKYYLSGKTKKDGKDL